MFCVWFFFSCLALESNNNKNIVFAVGSYQRMAGLRSNSSWAGRDSLKLQFLFSKGGQKSRVTRVTSFMNSLIKLILLYREIFTVGLTQTKEKKHFEVGARQWKRWKEKSSKYVQYIPLIGELVKRGHHVTFITNCESSELKKLPNVRQFFFPHLGIDMNKMPNSFNHLLSQDLFNFKAVKVLIWSTCSGPW